MLRTDVTLETLSRIGEIETDGRPVLSLYLDLAPEHFPLPAQRQAQVHGLLTEARHQSQAAGWRLDGEIKTVEDRIVADPDILRDGLGLAVFSARGGEVLETVRVPRAVGPLVAVDSVPWLEPLAEALVGRDVGVAVVSRASARLLRGGEDGLTEFAALHDDVHRRHDQGGMAQARYQRGIEQEVAWHLAHVCSKLREAHDRRPFSDLVLVTSSRLRPLLEQRLDPELRTRLAGMVDLDVEDASADTVRRLVAPVLERLGAQREHDLLERFDEQVATAGPAATGLDEVLSALNDKRVATLLLPSRARQLGRACTVCGRLSAGGPAVCPVDGADTRAVDAAEHAIQRAVGQAADVVILRRHPEALDRHGSIGALLRW